MPRPSASVNIGNIRGSKWLELQRAYRNAVGPRQIHPRHVLGAHGLGQGALSPGASTDNDFVITVFLTQQTGFGRGNKIEPAAIDLALELLEEHGGSPFDVPRAPVLTMDDGAWIIVVDNSEVVFKRRIPLPG